MFASFGNTVKIKPSVETDQLDLTGKVGIVYGQATPSVMNIEVIGNPTDDCAVNVHFEDLNQSFWFGPDLLETIDDGAGIEMTLKGVSKKWTKTADGDWAEENLPQSKSWWQFWK